MHVFTAQSHSGTESLVAVFEHSDRGSVLQGQRVILNLLVSLRKGGSAKQWSLVMRLNKAINRPHGKRMVEFTQSPEQTLQ